MAVKTRRANFNAGPAALPQAVLETLRDELLDWHGTGLSVLEMSHRSPDFQSIAAQAEADVRELLAVPENYRVLFLQGGATGQFGLLVQNLDIHDHVAVANTGHWSAKAMRVAAEATQVSEVCRLDSMSNQPSIPALEQWTLPTSECSFLHVCDNETIDGISYDEQMIGDLSQRLDDADTGVPLVADMSSSLFSRPVDVSQYGLIYASAQKNFGLAGLTLVIIRDDLVARSAARHVVSPVFSYAAMAREGSMLNTPPSYAWYAAGVIFRWLKEQGGLGMMYKRNRTQAMRLYDLIDDTSCYSNTVHAANRSIMNVPFRLSDEATTGAFLAGASKAGLLGLKGHKSMGGARASLYNACTDGWVAELLDYMKQFAANRS